ncbi:MAG: YgjP-like metallopeptidase domain-containing protein [Sphingobium sp.]
MPSDAAVIEVAGRSIPIMLRRHERARGYKLRLDRTGVAKLTMPARGSARQALAWAREQGAWIVEQLGKIEGKGTALADGSRFPLEGVPVTIRHDGAAPRGVRQDDDQLIVGGPAEHLAERVLRWLALRARTVLTQETLAIAAAQGLAVRSVGIGDPVSRWGSCSASGAIRYSWRLILAPPEVRISTVAHEVAHLRHLDHSPAFHAFHRAICPSDTMAARAWLRANGADLHRIGI